jgi:hypothetical protein
MIRLVKNIALFVFGVLLLYPVAVFVGYELLPNRLTPNVQPFTNTGGHLHRRLQEAELSSKRDILFLGSSHCYRGFDTRIFDKAGYSSFNLGSSSQTPQVTEVLLHRYLDRISPKLVVYEVYPVSFGIDGVESSLNLISSSPTDKDALKLAINTRNIKVLNTLIYMSIKQFVGDFTYVNSDRIADDTYISGGFVKRDLAHFSPPDSMPSISWKFRAENMNAFESNLEFIKSRDIPILFVFAPIAQIEYNAHNNNDEADSLFATYGNYINFNEICDLNDSIHFFDAHHLNQLGVESFNQALIRHRMFQKMATQ